MKDARAIEVFSIREARRVYYYSKCANGNCYRLLTWLDQKGRDHQTQSKITAKLYESVKANATEAKQISYHVLPDNI